MGLDMYLSAKRYLWDFGENNDNEIINAVGKLIPEMAGHRVKQIEVEIMYWRKANAIHKWFVDNVQDGVDECQEAYVSADKLVELQQVCQMVMDNPDRAASLLPSQSGFFFGGTEYDEGYFMYVERTLKWLDGMLTMGALDPKFKKWDFYYHSSW